MNIIEAIRDRQLFRSMLRPDLAAWDAWTPFLQALYGLPIPAKYHDLFHSCTGRDVNQLPTQGFTSALCLCGRRSGKSTKAALIAVFEATIGPGRAALAPGEEGIVLVLAPSRRQARKVKSYCRACFEQSPVLRAELIAEQSEGFDLRGNIRIEVGTADHRLIRSHTLLAAIVDEVCFLMTEEAKIKSDTELIQALRPALLTTRGRMISISSPYSRQGWAYNTWSKCFGNDKAGTLVWVAPSRTMNPSLPQSEIDKAMAEDPASARAEYLAEWRDDVAAFISRELVESLVVRGRKELMPSPEKRYTAFVDLSGGRADPAALCIAHQKDGKAILDLLRRYKPPFNPHEVIRQMVLDLNHFGIRRVLGDNYSAEFTCQAFRACGIKYVRSEIPASQIYLEALPRLCSGQVELLDSEVLIEELSGLERHTRAGGKDLVTHPSGKHDDVCNVACGAIVNSSRPVVKVGAFGTNEKNQVQFNRTILSLMAQQQR